ncbi:hypothetical protein P7K49_028655 [Saguinus oedipus]|uniref:Dystrobrevin beta n=1 Tax=Saguinus oedipus TaxID=9490 RepID=A0ABQ9U4Z3_SAGOE|nr:hypothetical protein P7K49_028655 [Saguinus oedipus]
MPVRSTSAGSTPTHCPQDSLSGVGGDVQEAFAQGTRRNLRNDLLVAADSITNTMSSLVKELHSGEIQSSHPASQPPFLAYALSLPRRQRWQNHTTQLAPPHLTTRLCLLGTLDVSTQRASHTGSHRGDCTFRLILGVILWSELNLEKSRPLGAVRLLPYLTRLLSVLHPQPLSP